MPAPPLPVQELDPEDLVAETEERSTSQTRRMGSNAQAALELEVRKSRPDGLDQATAGPKAGGDAHAVPAPPPAPGASPSPKPAPPPAAGEAPAEPGVSMAKPYLAGDVIAGKYRLTRIIGRGGMGAVWQAHNIPLDIDVAIKLIRRDRTAAGAAERLLTEARAAARLMHPSIVRVFDFGESEQGDPFIVMELLHGESLSAILRRKKRISPAVAVQTLLPVAAALTSAHGKGIVHRDLKPDNIIIVTHENGALQPKIVDFGIAKLLDIDRHVTLAGEVLGSPDYMSPEQARGADNVGEATDIWAFSVVLYEIITGVRPFDGHNYNALIAAILTNDPVPITGHGVGDGTLAAIIGQGLAKEIGERWTRMRDLGAALASWAVAQGIEDDVVGNSIAKQWLSGQAKRLLTVMPEGDALPPPPPPAAPQAGAAAGAVAGPPRPAMETMVGKPRRAPRWLWIAPAVASLGMLATAGYMWRGRIAQLMSGEAASAGSVAAEQAAASGAASAGAAPGDSASAPATAGSTSAPATSASAEPPTGASSAPSASAVPSGKPRPWKKNNAPRAPKNIKF